MENNLIVDDNSKFIFTRQGEWLIPIGKNFDVETGNFETLLNNSYMKIFIEYVIKSRQEIDPITNEVISKPLYPYQWVACLLPIISVFEEKGEKILEAFSRQSGKSESIKVWLPFILLFTRKFLKIKHKTFTGILGSYKQDTINKLRQEVIPYIYNGIKVFNEIYPTTPLEVEVDNQNKIELKMVRGNTKFDYSNCYFITLGVVQDSLSSHITVIDESGLCKADIFNSSISPFSVSTGGTQVFIGVPSNDPTSLIQQRFENEGIVKLLYDWTKCYTLMSLISKHDADVFKKAVLSEIDSTGGHRAINNRQNYYMEFSATTGRFLSQKIIEEHNMFCLTDLSLKYKDINSQHINTREYKVGSADISASAKGDYFVLSSGMSYFDDTTGRYITEVKDIYTINKNQDRYTAIQKAHIICDYIINNQLDVFIIDATSQQLHFVQVLRETMLKKDIPTLLIPFRYTNQSKRELFSRWEDALYSNTCKLPVVTTSWETKKLFEEMIDLIKEVKEGGLTYHAPDTSDASDDHCNAIALLNRALSYRDKAMAEQETFDDGGTREWLPHKARYIEIMNLKNNPKKTRKVVNLLYV